MEPEGTRCLRSYSRSKLYQLWPQQKTLFSSFSCFFSLEFEMDEEKEEAKIRELYGSRNDDMKRRYGEYTIDPKLQKEAIEVVFTVMNLSTANFAATLDNLF